MNKPHLVCVYGSLLSGLGNHRVMHRLGEEHFELLGTTKTEPNFKLFPLGSFPGINENGNTSITVEVYKITEELLQGPLDSLEGYNKDYPQHSMYIRKQIPTEFGDAWIYIYNRDVDSNLIEHGDWRKFKEEQYNLQNQ